jgi:predicted Zn-dependent peptidase
MENVGADINAYTSREETVIHVSYLAPYTERTLDLLFDISFQSIFPIEEVERERQVIMDEIRSGREQAFDTIHEDFESLLFSNHALGNPILGTIKSVKAIKREELLSFYRQNYIPENLIICSSNTRSLKQMIKSIEKISTASGFSAISSGIRNPQQYGKIPDNAIFSKEKSMAFEQAHCVIGNRAWSLHHPGRFALSLLNNLLAGPAMSSLISYQLREKLGLAYHVEGNFSAFEDTGQWLLYFATDPESLDKAKDQVFKTLKSLCDRQLGSLQLSRAKKQFAGQVFLMQDSNLQNILNAGKSLMTYQVVEGIEEIVKQIDSISGTSLLEAANEILAVDQLSVLEYRPKRR